MKKILMNTSTHSNQSNSSQPSLFPLEKFNKSSSNLNNIAYQKYKVFYERLYKCLCYLKTENYKLLEMIRNKQCIKLDYTKTLNEFLDEFAYKVANKKEAYEKMLISQAMKEGQQTFMAKRWKVRYYSLMELGLLIEKFLLRENNQKTDQEERTEEAKTKVTQTEQNLKLIRFFDEILKLPWSKNHISNKEIFSADNDVVMLNDHSSPLHSPKQSETVGINLSCLDFIDFDKVRLNQPDCSCVSSTYEYNDFIIPISSIFIQDLLANHNLCTEEIKQQNDVKYRLFHLLKRTKEQRNQLKKYVMEQQEKIQMLSKNIIETERIISKSQAVDANHQTVSGKDNLTPADVADQSTFPYWKTESDKVNEHEDEHTLHLKYLQNEIDYLAFRKRELQGMLSEEEQKRKLLLKKMHNLVNTVHVICRIKPNPNNYLQIISDDKIIIPKTLVVSTPRQIEYKKRDKNTDSTTYTINSASHLRCFIFDKVIGPDNSEYNDLIKQIGTSVTDCLKGLNLGIMVYGSKKSGKSFTMFGTLDNEQTTMDTKSNLGGVMYDVTNVLLTSINQKTVDNWSYTVRVQILSVRDDSVTDIFRERKSPMFNTMEPRVIDTTFRENDRIQISSPSSWEEFELNTTEDLYHLVKYVQEVEYQNKKCTSSTESESQTNGHLLVRYMIKGTKSSTDLLPAVESNIILVKLASWELKSEANIYDISDFEQEANDATVKYHIGCQDLHEKMSKPKSLSPTNVNKSLSTLSRVFVSLRKRKLNPPFHESYLTHLLKPVLSDNAVCFLILTIDTHPESHELTMSSLQFVQNAVLANTANLSCHTSKLEVESSVC
ncbi:unnamed protein product [Trichobilharzia szidati]|nr:unnamed protein product [Trichobilharzia szidati]